MSLLGQPGENGLELFCSKKTRRKRNMIIPTVQNIPESWGSFPELL